MIDEQIPNSEIYISLFNEIEHYLRQEYSNSTFKSFKELVRKASQESGVFKRYAEDLFEYAELRNAIVHNHKVGFPAIAEPSDEVTQNMLSIRDKILSPPKLSSFRKQVFTVNIDDNVIKALNLIGEKHFSVVPVLSGNHVVEMLNPFTITRWLAMNGRVDADRTKVREVLGFKEYSANYTFVSVKDSIYDAAELFRNSYNSPPQNRYYDALIITQNARNGEGILGIVVLKDIAQYL